MRIIKDEALIKRNGRIGQWTSLGALAVLGVGMYLSFQRPDLFAYSIGALILGFTMTQVGMYFSNRFGRSPRPDEKLDAGLKGLPGDTTLYHYVRRLPSAGGADGNLGAAPLSSTRHGHLRGQPLAAARRRLHAGVHDAFRPGGPWTAGRRGRRPDPGGQQAPGAGAWIPR